MNVPLQSHLDKLPFALMTGDRGILRPDDGELIWNADTSKQEKGPSSSLARSLASKQAGRLYCIEIELGLLAAYLSTYVQTHRHMSHQLTWQSHVERNANMENPLVCNICK